ncbi:hypothetical protein ACFVUW_28605 [Streptomyces xiamenensis]|uniref:hypothetical protein n=1 Tax=Streptomyces xiamenensis TaxID=408015 RepID=UPI0036EC291D
MLERWAIDDGRHVPLIEDDIVTSVQEGRDVVVVTCGCGGMPAVSAPRATRLAPHMQHLRDSQRLKGPAGLALGVRVALLMLADVGLFLLLQVAGDSIVPHPHGLPAVLARLAFVLAGFAVAAVLTVSLRLYIAPARPPRP